MRQMIDHPFHPQHPLRPPKATKGGGGLGVGFQAVRGDPDGGQQIGIIRMQHGPVGHRKRQVHRPTAAGIMGKIKRLDAAIRSITQIIVNPEIMPLAGDDHVIIAVITHLAGLAGQPGGNGTSDGQRVALGFLAAKPTPHPAHFGPDRVHRQANGLGDFVLNFSGILGRRLHMHLAILAGLGQSCLALQIEMLLPADLD